MKIKVIVKQVIVEEREVEVKNLAELQEKLEDQGEFIGRCVKPSATESLRGSLYDEQGRKTGVFDFLN